MFSARPRTHLPERYYRVRPTALIVSWVRTGSSSLNALGRSNRFSTLNAAIFMADPPFCMEPRHSRRLRPGMVFRLRGYRFRYLILSMDWTRVSGPREDLSRKEALPIRPVDTVGTSCAIVAHANESAMKNRWNQWNEERYLGLKRELRTGSLLAPAPRTDPPA